MSEDNKDIETLIRSSGCSDIQEALQQMDKHGISINDLSKETVNEVIKTMASAKSVGAQAAPVEKKGTIKTF